MYGEIIAMAWRQAGKIIDHLGLSSSKLPEFMRMLQEVRCGPGLGCGPASFCSLLPLTCAVLVWR